MRRVFGNLAMGHVDCAGDFNHVLDLRRTVGGPEVGLRKSGSEPAAPRLRIGERLPAVAMV
eukprot:10594537-Alexandrium_andersonii.AAC.1